MAVLKLVLCFVLHMFLPVAMCTIVSMSLPTNLYRATGVQTSANMKSLFRVRVEKQTVLNSPSMTVNVVRISKGPGGSLKELDAIVLSSDSFSYDDPELGIRYKTTHVIIGKDIYIPIEYPVTATFKVNNAQCVKRTYTDNIGNIIKPFTEAVVPQDSCNF